MGDIIYEKIILLFIVWYYNICIFLVYYSIGQIF